MLHPISKQHGILLAPEVQPPDLTHVTPLVEARSGLVILEAFDDRAVYHNLLVLLDFAADHTEGVVAGVVVDVDAAEDLRPGARRNPFLVGVIVDHHRGSSLADARLTHVWLEKNSPLFSLAWLAEALQSNFLVLRISGCTH